MIITERWLRITTHNSKYSEPTYMNLQYFRIILLTPIIFCVAALSGLDAYVGLLRVNSPNAALSIYKDDPVSLSAKVEIIILKGISAGQLKEVHKWSEKSFLSYALNPRALGQIALSNGAIEKSETEDGVKTKVILKVAQKMSRRDMIVQLWNVEQSKSEGRISDALYQYDIGMRVNEARGIYFFPTLLSDLKDVHFRKEFAKYISRNPPWMNEFLNFSIEKGDRPDLIASLIFESGGLPKEKKFRITENALLGKLFSQLGPKEARSFYLTLKHDANVSTLMSLNFDRISTNPDRAPLSWVTMKSSNGESEFSQNNDSKSYYLRGDISPGQTESIARKLVYMPSGQYHPEIKLVNHEFGAGATALMKVSCVKPESIKQIWQGNIVTDKPMPILTVPNDCEAQFFDIVLYGGDNQVGAEITIKQILLNKIP